MEIKDLRSGMRVLTKGTIEHPEEYGLVLDDEIFIFSSGVFSGSWAKSQSTRKIIAVWEPNTPKTTNIGTDFLKFMLYEKYWHLVWKEPLPVVEMTLTEICEALGKNIKIVKEQ